MLSPWSALLATRGKDTLAGASRGVAATQSLGRETKGSARNDERRLDQRPPKFTIAHRPNATLIFGRSAQLPAGSGTHLHPAPDFKRLRCVLLSV